MTPDHVEVTVVHDGDSITYWLAPRDYEALRTELDHRETGWREYPSLWTGALILFRLEDVHSVAYWPESASSVLDDWNRQQKTLGLTEDS